jgi:ABC-2 type transport system permease protein
MSFNITKLDILLRKKSILGYTLGMLIYVLIIIVFFPAFKNSTSLDSFISKDSSLMAMFGITGKISTSGGWLNGNIYANFFPLILLMLTIGYGASSIAGQDEDGILCLITTLPISRRAILLQKILAMTVQSLIVGLFVGIGVTFGHIFGITTPYFYIFELSLNTVLLSVDFGLLSMITGIITGKRIYAIATTTSVASASYLIGSLATIISWLNNAKYFSLFYWSVGNNQILNGISINQILVLLTIGLILTITAGISFKNADLH